MVFSPPSRGFQIDITRIRRSNRLGICAKSSERDVLGPKNSGPAPPDGLGVCWRARTRYGRYARSSDELRLERLPGTRAPASCSAAGRTLSGGGSGSGGENRWKLKQGESISERTWIFPHVEVLPNLAG